MLHIFQPITKYFKIKRVSAYGSVFGLHCRLTVALLVACAIIVSAKEYFGKAIECISDVQDKDFLSTFCWVSGTYIATEVEDVIGSSAAGVGVRHTVSELRIHQRYYPWIVLFLFFQAIIFSAPAYMWKIWEGGRLEQLCEDLKSVFVPKEWDTERKKLLTSYLSSSNGNVHMCYVIKYFICEVLNLTVCIINLVLLNIFFSGFWEKFGPAISSITYFDWMIWNKKSSVLFPKIAKCEFFKFGTGGSVESYDALCVLPLNMLNDKIFTVLALWLIFLTAVSAMNILYKVYVFSSPKHRARLIRAQLNGMLPYHTNLICSGMQTGDWFMLYQLGRNINPTRFRELAEALYDKKKEKLSNDA